MALSISKKIICATLFLGFLFLPTTIAFGEDFGEFSGLNETAKTQDNYDLDKNDIPVTVGNIISYILSLLGIIMLIITVIAYIVMSSAGGNEEEVNKAKKWIKNAIIAMVIIMAAYLLVAVFTKFWTSGVFDN
ncbi:MAG: pilin [Patescibacteria group bacterium]|jgi:amino acid transporter